MLSFDEALSRILAAVPAPTAEHLQLEQAPGRALAQQVLAGHDQPPFDASAMDGYAVRAADIEIGKHYPVIGESQAGGTGDFKLGAGEVARIFTGAPMPAGADAVIIQEDAQRVDDRVEFTEPATAGQNIRPRGLDFASGEVLLRPGVALNPAHIALTAAANVAHIDVYRRPRVALLSTGDELVPPGSVLRPGEIIGSNSFALQSLFAPYAARVTNLGNVADDEAELRKVLGDALSSDADFIVTSGGASVGDHDLVQPVLKSFGVEVDFWKIAMRPGKPLMFGQWKGKLLFALPGNPVSAFVTAFTLVLPALRKAAGLANPKAQTLCLPLATALPANGSRKHFLRGELLTEDGQTKVRPFSQTDSSHLSTLAKADVLLVQPENSPALDAGAHAQVLMLQQ